MKLTQTQISVVVLGAILYINHIYNNVSKYLSFEKVGFQLRGTSGVFIQVDNRLVGLPIDGIKIELYSGNRVFAEGFLKPENDKLQRGQNKIFVSLSSLNLQGIQVVDLLDYLSAGIFAKGYVDTKFGKLRFNSKVI